MLVGWEDKRCDWSSQLNVLCPRVYQVLVIDAAGNFLETNPEGSRPKTIYDKCGLGIWATLFDLGANID